MSRLQELIQKLCPDGVKYRKLGDKRVCVMQRGTAITKKDIVEGNVPVIAGGQKPAYYCDRANRTGETITIAGSGAYAGFVSYWDTPIFVSDAFSIKGAELCTTKYLYYLLVNMQDKIFATKNGAGIPHVHIKNIENFEVPVPHPNVQEEIVRILDAFTSYAAELQAELQARKEQYAYYRDQLLTFDEHAEGIEWKKLGEIGTFTRGNGLQKKDFTETGFPCIHYGQIHTHYGTFADTTISYTSNALAQKLRKASYGDLIIATTSEDVEGVCKACTWLGKEDVAVSGDSYIYKHNQNPKYIAYLFQTKLFYEYKRKAAIGTKVVRVTGKSMENFIFPIPSLIRQQRIVSILDKFEALVNDLTEGLPAEIAAVQEQYEYYRNKLLSFPKIAEV